MVFRLAQLGCLAGFSGRKGRFAWMVESDRFSVDERVFVGGWPLARRIACIIFMRAAYLMRKEYDLYM